MNIVHKILFFAFLIVTMGAAIASPAVVGNKMETVKFVTNLGDFVVALDEAAAPTTVKNFNSLVKNGFYNGLIFHRVIPGFMIQGGGFTPDMQQKADIHTIKNEARNGLKNTRGTIAMARTADPDSASAQFFINLADNPALDYKGDTREGAGYTVFGYVVSGMNIIDKISALATSTQGMYENVPIKVVKILQVTVQKA